MRKAFRVLGAGLRGVAFAALLAVLLFEVYALARGRALRRIALPPNVGNFERVRAPLEAQQAHEGFAFGVIGDPHGSGTFPALMGQLGREPLAFVVLLGDYMQSPSLDGHRFFISRLSKDISAPFPVFLAVGNHDVNKERFPAAEFERLYGPTNFWFSHRGCLFIVLRVIDNPLGPEYTTSQSLRFLESVLAEQRARHERVFIFQHYPLPVSDDFRIREYPEADEEIRLCDRYRVDYVISGDFHGFARVKLRNTVYLITGGGGGRLTTRMFGSFHHAIVLRLGPEGVSERILYSPGLRNTWGDELERHAVLQVRHWILGNPTVAVAGNAAILAACAWLVRAFLSSRRRARAAGGDSDA